MSNSVWLSHTEPSTHTHTSRCLIINNRQCQTVYDCHTQSHPHTYKSVFNHQAFTQHWSNLHQQLWSTDLRNCRNSSFFIVLHSNGHFSGEPGLAGYTAAKDDGGGDDNWSYKTSKAPVNWSPPTNQHPAFYRPDAHRVKQPLLLCPRSIGWRH